MTPSCSSDHFAQRRRNMVFASSQVQIFFRGKQAYLTWQRICPLVERVGAHEWLPPDRELPHVDVLFIDPEHLLVRMEGEMEFFPVVRCTTEEEAHVTWFEGGTRVYARYLTWPTTREFVSGQTVEKARVALQNYLCHRYPKVPSKKEVE